jgi:hypothetical protein
MSNVEKSAKYVLLLSRDLTKKEKDELEKWFSVFNYSKNKIALTDMAKTKRMR